VLRRCGAEARGKGARSCAEDASEAVHGVQPGEHRTAHQPLEGESLGVDRDVHDAVEGGEREQARSQQQEAGSEGRTEQRAGEHDQRGGQGTSTPHSWHCEAA
jgi:hypothetical protein